MKDALRVQRAIATARCLSAMWREFIIKIDYEQGGLYYGNTGNNQDIT